MVSVINRVTKEFIPSVSRSYYPSSDWIYNPDMSEVEGLPRRLRVIEGDDVRAMTSHENDLNHLSEEKAAKIAVIDSRTEELISRGFVYRNCTFSLSASAQSKMIGSHQIKDHPALVYPIKWNTLDDDDTLSLVDSADLDAFYLTALGTIRYHLDSGTELKDEVRSATTIIELNQIADNR